MNDISLKQLEIFVAVVEYGGFTRAAEELFFNQSTVSAHISLLEQALGKELFVRSNRRHVRLTKEGEQVYPIARRILNDCAALRTLFSDADSAPVVALGASTVPGQYLVPGYLAAFLQTLDALPTCFLTLAFFSFRLLFLLVHLCQQLYQGRFQNLCSDFSSFDAQRDGFLVDFFLHGCSPPIYHRCIRGGLPRLQAVRYHPAPSETSCGTGAADSRTPICVGSACRDGRCPFPDAGASCVQTDCL